jgi:replicative DNA helicase
MIEKRLPHNLQAEIALLGGCLNYPKYISKVANLIDPSDFYRSSHKYICRALFELKEKADLVAVHNWLDQNNLLQKCGGQQFLASLCNAVSTGAGYEYHAKIVKEMAMRRKLIDRCQITVEKAYKLTENLDEILSNARQHLNSLPITDSFHHRTFVDLANVYTPEKCLEEYSEYIKTLKQNRFITGIHAIDKRIRGVAGGEVLFWIARAGSFKTAMLQNILKDYVQHSAWGAVFFSIEMPISSLTERYHEIIQGSTGRDIEEIYATSQNGTSQIKEALESRFIEELKNLFIIPTKVSISDVASYVKLVEKEYQTKIGVIGIDYLGLMDGPGQGEYEIVSRLARDCKGLAKLLDLPVVIISQTSRRAGSGDIEISLDMGRGSGAIEESADFALGLFQVERERLSTEDQEPDYDLICKVLKNRKGPKGSRWKLDLDPTNLRIGPNVEPWEPTKTRKGNDL